MLRGAIRSIKNALRHKGFGFVEVLSPCPTQYGRRNENPTPIGMLRALKENCVTQRRAQGMTAEELVGKTTIGEFVVLSDAESAEPD
jgi:2-oxoglutarate ferredoxin oxidoreductase subunit beta